VLEKEAAAAGDCAAGDGGSVSANGEVDANADCGPDGSYPDEDKDDLTLGGDAC